MAASPRGWEDSLRPGAPSSSSRVRRTPFHSAGRPAGGKGSRRESNLALQRSGEDELELERQTAQRMREDELELERRTARSVSSLEQQLEVVQREAEEVLQLCP